MKQRITWAIALAALTASSAANRTVTLNASANVAVLEDDGNPTNKIVRLRSTNGSFAAISFEMPTANLTIDLGAGNDSLTINGTALFDQIPNLRILGRGGNDSIALSTIRIAGNVTSDDPLGNNSFSTDLCTISGNLTVSDGPGLQIVRLQRATSPLVQTATGSILVQSTDGGSQLDFGTGFESYPIRVGGNVTVQNLGYGSDNVRLYGRFNGNIDWRFGNGDLNATSTRTTIDGAISSLVQSGISTYALFEVSAGAGAFLTSYEGSTDIQIGFCTCPGGLFLSSGLGHDVTKLIDVFSPLVDINTGDGGSDFSIRNGLGGPVLTKIDQLQITNGEGTDISAVSQSANPNGFIKYITILNGEGNSSVSVTGQGTASPGIAIDSIRIANEDGFDNLLVQNAVIRGELVAYNGNGGSESAIRDSQIGGLGLPGGDIVDLNSNAGTDDVRLLNSDFNAPVAVTLGNDDDSLTLTDSLFLNDFDAEGGAGYDILNTTNDSIFNAFSEATGFEFIFEF